MMIYLQSLAGGMILGAAAIFLLIFNGRIAGISGIVGRLLNGSQAALNAAFVLGLILGPVVYAALFGSFPVTTISASWPIIVVAGLLVGIGTRMGSGCTSGHGILGMARFSKRSIAATITFLITGVAAATLTGVLL
ncbi:YeeE/YedE family protein [Ochrobactrum teleogrylli]|uniref:YeeE/YedE family protein n=1 Tax=Ochrobactrum teleogrylli TaxID=2479765 RepID=A0ABY2YAS4_9HYPH|nr:YeeE/YedE family protein [[Ochrobactrum] teleogrylli]TNV18521.1 YeeE/YedE family protein [[Ochrobactrum] teleogrylli]